MQPNEITITEPIIKEIIANYTKESGVRELERFLRSLVQKYLLNQETAEDKTVHLDIDKKLLEEYFVSKKLSKEKLNQVPAVGKIKGLAYTSIGGSTISIEAMASGTGKIKATGKLGEVLKESIEVAFPRAIDDLREKEPQILDISENDIHVHLLEGAAPKEGPSAGITVYAAITPLLSGIRARQDVAMTGEIGLYGDVLEIGGLKEKLMALSF